MYQNYKNNTNVENSIIFVFLQSVLPIKMEEEITQNSTQGMLTGIMITLFAAFIAVLAYSGVFTLAYYTGRDFGYLQNIVFSILSVIAAVAIAQILSRVIQGNKLSFLQAFLSGWMASLILGMFINFFFSIFIRITKMPPLPEGSFAQVLLLFSMLGIFTSLILSFFTKKS